MMQRLLGWIADRQRRRLETDKKVESLEHRARTIRKMVIADAPQQMSIAEINPVYDRIKGRPREV